MLHGLRGYAAVVGCAAVLSLVTGCGNKSEVCDDTKKAFESLAAQVRTAPAADAAKWRHAVGEFAARLDALAKKSSDATLKKALQDASAAARNAATGVGNGDAAPLQRFLSEQPQRIGDVCS